MQISKERVQSELSAKIDHLNQQFFALKHGLNKEIDKIQNSLVNTIKNLQNFILKKKYCFEHNQELESLTDSILAKFFIRIHKNFINFSLEKEESDCSLIDFIHETEKTLQRSQEILNIMKTELNQRIVQLSDKFESNNPVNTTLSNRFALLDQSVEEVYSVKPKLVYPEDLEEYLSDFKFSPIFKSDSIKITDKNAVLKEKTNNVYRLSLLNQTLENLTPKIHIWSIKIEQATPNWIGIGMVHYNQANRQEFEYESSFFDSRTESTNRNDHGGYLITSNGWLFETLNKPRKIPFAFGKSDTITMRFDPYVKVLSFFKNFDWSCPLNIPYIPICWNKLYPCVIFWYDLDEVSIVELEYN